MSMAEHSFWLLPAQADAAWLDGIVATLAPVFGTPAFRAHVTVQGDIAADGASLHEQLHMLAGLCPPWRWQVQALTCSEHFFRAFYLALAPHPCFDRLCVVSSTALGTTDGRSPFPHLSLAYGEPAAPQRKPELMARYAPECVMREILIDRVALVRSSKDVPIADWRLLDELPLAGS